MKKRARKAIKRQASKVKSKMASAGTKLLVAARKRIEIEVGALKAAGILSQSDAQKLLAEFMKELNMEKDRFLSFAKKEAIKTAGKVRRRAIPVARKALANYKKVRAKKTAPKKRKR